MNETRKKCDPPDGGYGWVIVLMNVTINACLLILVQCFGIIFHNDFQSMGVTAAQTSFLLHLHNSIFCCIGLLASPLLKKYNFKDVALLGSFLMSTGIGLTAFAKSFTILLLTVSVLIGVGQGILMPALYLATNTYFKKRLTLAVSFGVTGGSLSLIFMPQICNLLLNLYGTQYTILILFAISLHAFPCCLLLRPLKKRRRNREERRLRELQHSHAAEINDKDACEKLVVSPDDVYRETTVPKPDGRILSKIVRLFDLELLTQRPYVVVIIGMSVSFVSELNIVLMIPFVLTELADFSRKEVSDFLSVQYTADLLARLVVPLVAHKAGWSAKIMYAVSLLGSSVGRTGLVIFCDSRLLITYTVSIILGVCKGSKAVFQSLIIPNYVGLEQLPAATGLSMVLNGILSLAIGPIIGLVHDLSESYVYALHTASAMSISCVVLWLCESACRKKNVEQAVTLETL